MSIQIAQASISENGTVRGTSGDQTGSEINIHAWYSFPWNVYLECNDSTIAQKAANYMKEIANNSSFGYSQDNRWAGYYSIKNNGGKVSGASGDFDCSSLVISCYALAGLPITTGSGYTGTIESTMLATGKFTAYRDSAHLTNGEYGKTGGIYLNTTSHVVMAISDGSLCSKNTSTATTTTTTVSTSTVNMAASTSTVDASSLNYKKVKLASAYTPQMFIKDIQTIEGVTVDGIAGPITLKNTKTLSKTQNSTDLMVGAVQMRLMKMGYKLPKYGADGDFGDETEDAVKELQEDIYNGKTTDVDGEITAGMSTWKRLLALI